MNEQPFYEIRNDFFIDLACRDYLLVIKWRPNDSITSIDTTQMIRTGQMQAIKIG